MIFCNNNNIEKDLLKSAVEEDCGTNLDITSIDTNKCKNDKNGNEISSYGNKGSNLAINSEIECSRTDLTASRTNSADSQSETTNASLLELPSDAFINILKDGSLQKQVLARGLGRDTIPNQGDFITINCTAWNERNILIGNTEETFVLGDGDIFPAFDLALREAEMQEEFMLKADARHAYGEYGMLPNVQSNEALIFRIKLISSEPQPNYDSCSTGVRLEAVEKKRMRANTLYKRESYSDAIRSYLLTIKIIESDPYFKTSTTKDTEKDIFKLFIMIENNLAAAQLKIKDFAGAIETCDKILRFDRKNVGALFRKGLSLKETGRYSDALIVLEKAYELDRKNMLIKDAIGQCRERTGNTFYMFTKYAGVTVCVAVLSVVVVSIVVPKLRAK